LRIEVKKVDSFRVLLVDDEKDFLETLVKRLRKRKLDVIGASGGLEAVAIITAEPVDVVVLDVKMPDLNGIDTLKRIKTIRPSAEVIMLTGHADMEVAIQGMELGAFDYLMKPADIDELLYKIQDAYKKKSCMEGKPRSRTPSGQSD
jgi:DNA-binding NtrC family response regulator